MAQRPVIEGARRTCPFRHFEHGEHRARFDHHAWRRTANEIDSAVAGDDADSGNGDDGALDTGKIINRGIARGVGRGAKTPGSSRAKSNSEIVRSFDGLNFFDQRFANNGNQFSVEPPDQGLCVGNGFVMESVNNAIKIYDTAGNLLVGPIDDNTFYGYPAAINRSTGARGPDVTDPSCLYDADTKRWFHLVLTLDRIGTRANLAGTNHLDIAVSDTSDPTGTWTIYSLPVQNNGTQGTPDHHCDLGFCLGDYPHIGADANGIYLTTNEFSLFGDGFNGAQIYAIGKLWSALDTGRAGPRRRRRPGDPCGDRLFRPESELRQGRHPGHRRCQGQ